MVKNQMAHLLEDGIVPVRLARGAAADAERPAFAHSFVVSVVYVLQKFGKNLSPFRKIVAQLSPPASSSRGRVSRRWAAEFHSAWTARGGRPHVILCVCSRRFARQQLPQNKLQDSTVGVVLCFLRSVDSHQSLELFCLAVHAGPHVYLTTWREASDEVADAGDLENLLAG